MSHQEKQRIFDRISIEKWKLNFKDFLCGTINEVHGEVLSTQDAIIQIEEIVFTACDLVQDEQMKRIAESITMKYHDGSTKNDSFIEYYQIGADNLQVDKSSITNPENKIQ